MEFLNLYNQSEFKNLVLKNIQDNTVSHAYLICGQDEILLNFYAVSFAKQILCKDICGTCHTCIKIEKGVHADVLVYPKGQKGLVVEDVNNIVENAYVYPLESNKKIIIINLIENSTVQAQNKLLKTLEEPPQSTMFIITSTNPSHILNTVKSRTKIINIPLLSNAQVKDFILANSSIKRGEVDAYVVSSQGNLAKALKIIQDPDFIKIKELGYNTIINLKESGDILKFSSKILNFKDRLDELFDEFNLVILDILYAKSGLNTFVKDKNKIQEYLSSGFSIKALKLISQEILNAKNKLKSNCMANSVVDNFLLTMLEVKHKWK